MHKLMIGFLSESDLYVVLRMNILQNRKSQQLFVKLKRVKKVTKIAYHLTFGKSQKRWEIETCQNEATITVV